MSYKNWRIIQACLKFKELIALWSLWLLVGISILGYHSWAKVPEVFFPQVPYLGWTASLLNDLALYSMIGILTFLVFFFWDEKPKKKEGSPHVGDLELNFSKELIGLGIFFSSYAILSWNVEILNRAWIGLHVMGFIVMFMINLIMVMMVLGVTGIASYALWDQILDECKPKGVALEAENEKKYLEQTLDKDKNHQEKAPSEKRVKRL